MTTYGMMSAYSFFRGNTTHHRHPVGKFIFLVERVTVWGKKIDLYLLRVNLSWLFALRSRPLRHISKVIQNTVTGKNPRGHGER